MSQLKPEDSFFQKSRRLIDNKGLNRIFKIIEKKVMDIKL